MAGKNFELRSEICISIVSPLVSIHSCQYDVINVHKIYYAFLLIIIYIPNLLEHKIAIITPYTRSIASATICWIVLNAISNYKKIKEAKILYSHFFTVEKLRWVYTHL